MNKAIYAALFVSLILFSAETSFLVGALLGAHVKSSEVENACLYTNRLELTKGRVIECQYLKGVTIK